VNETKLRQVIPVLRIFSVERAKEFYLDFLGFTLDWEHRSGIEDEPWGVRVMKATDRFGNRLLVAEPTGKK